MSNELYNATGFPLNSADGQAVDMRAELLAIMAGFDKFPALSTNALKLLMVNAAGTAFSVAETANLALTPWTPTLSCVTPGNLAITYTTRVGYEFRLAGIILRYFDITTSAFTHTTASGQVKITGIPSITIALSDAISTLTFQGITKANYTQFGFQIFSNATTMGLMASGSGQGLVAGAITDLPTGGTVVLQGTTVQFG